ncbi:fungal specific transcription factor domain-containing protein ASCRUDRAFT_36949 [Ascoidea rubescens DSM 1968]|uniref:Uncharacterized protein n=1 Tax=Ascoidea rubescens DSM 1968 TaxID=1344418 RepID=A0A1D2VEB2_9ASCO|nr:hypothetical protein ASCRUDRAFT_36949 [Ascoidea rubescens DSM 1968]ODV59922.1 hypothetical protein ASCRUDRAFT_36949 [Ascoidea rubescens DSM 1968]
MEVSDSKPLIFLEYYCSKLAKSFSIISDDKSNCFLNVYIPMASNNESILYGLIAWGGKFLNDSLADKYLDKAINLLEKQYNNFSKIEKKNLLITMACSMILMDIEITTGDVKRWSKFINICKKLIEISGGIKNLIETIEGKFLISNFFYSDILSSITNENGTMLPIEDYNIMFNRIYENFIEEGEELADPIQSCLKPLFLIMGEIINFSTQINQFLYEGYDIKRRIDNNLDDNNLDDNGFDDKLEENLTLFELFQMTLKLFLKTSLKKHAAILPEIQYLLLKINQLVDILIGSSVKGVLCFPMIIAGINSVLEQDRLEMIKRFDFLINIYNVGNFKRAKEIVKESWKLNPNGEICLNWYDVANKFNWHLNLG